MARKRKVKAGKPAAAPKRLSCPLPAKTYARLGAFAHWRGLSIGAVVTRAVEGVMSAEGFVVYTGDDGDDEGTPPALSSATAIGQDEPGEGETLRAG
jgi:hypothetical protein